MIGAALIAESIKNETEIYAIVRKGTERISRIPASPLVHIVYAGLDELESVLDVPNDIDTFYHFAWDGTTRERRNDPELQERNIRYTLDSVKLAEKCGCKKYIGAGSQAEYGPCDEVINESTAYRPATPYGCSKLTAGMLSREMCNKKGISHVWGRIFSAYGKYDNDGTMLNYAIDSFLAGEEASFSPGRQAWDYLNESDAGRAFYLLGEKEEACGDFCIAYGESRPLREYILELARMMDAEKLCHFAEGDTKVYGLRAETDKLRKVTGFKPEISFEEGIRSVIEYRSNK